MTEGQRMPGGPPLTRRERRIERERARRGGTAGGWFGYGVGVVFVTLAAAVLAVGAGLAPTPHPVAPTSVSNKPDVALDRTTTTTPGAGSPQVETVVDQRAPSSTTTTTVDPIIRAASTAGEPTTVPTAP